MRERPNIFRLDPDHSLSDGLVFAGLGAHAGGTHYHDSGPFGYNGTLVNMAPSKWVPAIGRQALQFVPGDSPYVTLGNVLNFGTDLFTISAWIRQTGTTNYGVVCAKGTANVANEWTIYDLKQASLGFDMCFRSVTGWATGSPSSLSGAGWTHICVTGDNFAPPVLTWYVNGVLVHSDIYGSIRPDLTNTHAFTIGARLDGTEQFFEGDIADVVCYKKLATLPEIQTLANPSDPMYGGWIQPPKRKWFPVKYPAEETTTTFGIIPTRKRITNIERPEQFQLDENHSLSKGLVFAGLGAHAGGSYYHDSGPFGNSGVLEGMDATAWNPLIGRAGCTFAGTDDCIVLPNGFWNPSLPLTVSCWARNTESSGMLMYGGTVTSNYGYALAFSSAGLIYFGSDAGFRRSSTPDFRALPLAHFVGTHDGSGTVGGLAVFANGVRVDDQSVGSFTGFAANAAYPSIGCRIRTTTKDRFMIGDVCDVLVHNRVLTLSEIQTLANPYDPMYGGWIQPVGWRWTPWAVAGGAAAFNPIWAKKTHNLLGSGVS